MSLLQRIKTRLINAFGYSIAGLKAAWRHEEAFRFEVALVILLFPAALWLADSYTKLALLMGSCLLVVLVELLNSAIEAVVDQVTEEYAELAGRAKDLGSAAVMLSLFVLVIIWLGVAADRWWV